MRTRAQKLVPNLPTTSVPEVMTPPPTADDDTTTPAPNTISGEDSTSAEVIQTNDSNEVMANKKSKKTSDDEASTILLSLKTTNDNSEVAGAEEVPSAPAPAPHVPAPAPVREVLHSTTTTSTTTNSTTIAATSATNLTPLSDTVLPVPPALAGTEVLDEAEYNRRMTLEYLRQYFHLPLNEVAQLWGISKPAFKKLCRQHGIKRWPSRQVSSIISSITMLQNFCQENELPDKILKEYESRLAALHTSLEQIMQAPTLDALSSDPAENAASEASSMTALESSSMPAAHIGSEAHVDVPVTPGGVEMPVEESVLLHTPDSENKKKRRRSSGGASRMNVHSPLDPHTGWVAECHRCGKLGKFRNVFEGRPFQHSTGDGKYCGYFRLNPRKMGTPAPSPIAPLAVPESSQSIPIAPEISPDVESSPTLDALPDFPPTTAA